MKKRVASYILTLAILMQTIGLFPALETKAADTPSQTISVTTNGNNYLYYDMEVAKEEFANSPAGFLKSSLTTTVLNKDGSPIQYWGNMAYPIVSQLAPDPSNGGDTVDLNYALDKLTDQMYNASVDDAIKTGDLKCTDSNAQGNIYTGRYSGLQNADSLSAAQDQILSLIHSYYRNAGGTKDKISDAVKSNDYLKDSTNQTVFYQVLGAFKSDKDENTKKGHYRAYAIIYDNFQVSPIVDPDNMKNTATNQIYGPVTNSSTTYGSDINNNTAEVAKVERSLSTTSTQIAKSEINGSRSYEFGQTITTKAGFSIGSLFDASVEVAVNASQAIEDGWSNSTAVENSMEDSTASSIDLPPYTSALLTQSKTQQTVSTEYQCPVSISYDVTIVNYMKSPSSDNRYTDLITTFSGNACDNMESRAYFDYPSISDKDGINWAKVKNYAGSSMTILRKNRPMNYQGGTFSVDINMTKSQFDGVVPLYPLKEIETTNDYYRMNMTQGESIYTDIIPLYGFNEQRGSYYGFNKKQGDWELIDENTDPLSPDVAYLEYDSITRKTRLVAGNVEGKAYLRYNIFDDTYPIDPKNTELDTYLGKDDIDTAVVELNISEKPFYGSIEVLGELNGIANDTPISLNEAFDTIIKDEQGYEVKRPITWAAEWMPDRGIEINGNEIFFTSPGVYKIQAKTSNAYSNWIEIVVSEERKANSIQIEDKTDPSILEATYDETTPVIVDLGRLNIEAFDQYEAAWSLGAGEWKCDNTNVVINGDTLITETPGSYQIRYEAEGIASNELTLNVYEKPHVKSIKITGQVPVLYFDNTGKSNFDLSTLAMEATDQYGQPIVLDSSLFKWNFTTGGYASISGNTITGKIMGEDTLTLSYPGENVNGNLKYVKANKLTIKITPEYYLDAMYYNGGAAEGIEATAYNLNSIPLVAKNQHGGAHSLPNEANITWTLSNRNECKKAVIDQTNKTITVPAGTIEKGGKATVIVNAACNETGKVAKDIAIEFKQRRYLDTFTISQTKTLVLKNGENAKISDYFSASGKDQYGDNIGVGNLTWYSDDSKIVQIDGNAILGKTDNKSTTIYAKSGLITSTNKIKVEVEKKPVITSIEVEGSPGMATLSTDIDINKFKVSVYDQYGDKFSEKDLSAYPAKIRWTLKKKDTSSTFDSSKNILSTGKKEGVIELTASAENSGTHSNLAEKKIYIAISKEKVPNFADTNTNDWFYSDANYMYARNLMRGKVDDEKFAPYAKMTRAEAVTLLYRIAALDPSVNKTDLNTAYKNEFKDVSNSAANSWYTKGLAWASKTGIMTGYTDGRFAPTDNITREQMCTILYRYAKKYGHDTSVSGVNLNNFSDKNKISPFAAEAVSWAIGKKIIVGKGTGTTKNIAPTDTILRAEVAVVAQRFIDLYEF